MGMPTIHVEFQALAASAAVRSVQGTLAVVLRDATKDDWTVKRYESAGEVNRADFTAANYNILLRAFTAGPARVTVIRLGASAALSTIKTTLDNLAFAWICTPVAGLQAELAAYVKESNGSRVRKIKGLVTGVTGADDLRVVNVVNTGVYLEENAAVTAMAEYLPRLAGVLAACGLTESVTYYELSDLADIAPVSDLDTAIDGGGLCLFREDTAIRIARGVNTMTTTGTNRTEAMKKIAVVEVMDLIQGDIIQTFRNNYMGKVRNSADNQALFLAEILSYFRQLEAQSILDPDEGSTVDLDVAAMRQAWADAGTSLTGLTDGQVRRKPFGSHVYVTASIRILDVMEDLHMVIGLQ